MKKAIFIVTFLMLFSWTLVNAQTYDYSKESSEERRKQSELFVKRHEMLGLYNNIDHRALQLHFSKNDLTFLLLEDRTKSEKLEKVGNSGSLDEERDKALLNINNEIERKELHIEELKTFIGEYKKILNKLEALIDKADHSILIVESLDQNEFERIIKNIDQALIEAKEIRDYAI